MEKKDHLKKETSEREVSKVKVIANVESVCIPIQCRVEGVSYEAGPAYVSYVTRTVL